MMKQLGVFKCVHKYQIEKRVVTKIVKTFLAQLLVMHLWMVCPRIEEGGNPGESNFMKLYQGRDFDI